MQTTPSAKGLRFALLIDMDGVGGTFIHLGMGQHPEMENGLKVLRLPTQADSA